MSRLRNDWVGSFLDLRKLRPGLQIQRIQFFVLYQTEQNIYSYLQFLFCSWTKRDFVCFIDITEIINIITFVGSFTQVMESLKSWKSFNDVSMHEKYIWWNKFTAIYLVASDSSLLYIKLYALYLYIHVHCTIHVMSHSSKMEAYLKMPS